MGKKKKQEKSEKLKKNKIKEEKVKKSKKADKSGKQDKAKKQEKAARALEQERLIEAEAAVQTSGRPVSSHTEDEALSKKDSADSTRMAEIFRAFGDVNRLQILDLLRDGELCARELLDAVDIVQSTLSHHMKLLVEAGVVKCRKQGKWSYYSLDRETMAKVSEYLMNL
jgi:ArsR family transcriptional regulator